MCVSGRENMALPPPVSNAFGQGPQLRLGEKIRILEKALKKIKFQLDQRETQLREANNEISELKKDNEKVSKTETPKDGPFIDPETGKEYKSAIALKGALTRRRRTKEAKDETASQSQT